MEAEAVAQDRIFVPDLAGVDRSRRRGEPEWLAALRREARDRFRKLGFPSAKLEEWRTTNVGPILSTPWIPELHSSAAVRGGGPGVRVLRLAEAIAEEPQLLERTLGRAAGPDDAAFPALNLALAEDVLCVLIAPGAAVPAPIEIAFETPASSEPPVSYPRCLVVAADRSEATVIERHEGTGAYFRNAVTEIALGEGSVLRHYKLEQESLEAFHLQTIAVRMARASHFTSVHVAFGGALARTDIRADLEGEGSECALDGLFVGAGSQHLDTHTTIVHAAPHTMSREVYKGVLDGRARGVFHGRIVVRPGAQKTDAMQTNKNLLLSRDALVDSTPALEIFADDVKCKHGSTIGQLDANALFYLRSRGLGEADARSLLTWAFAADVAERIPVESVRVEVERALGQKLPNPAAEARR
jgi:Fe-S cluster assembly protein SufD